jgi:DNA helicase-2/ATP-dependent DNA helicase PcrA|tara:strand:- start:330 stop:1829 length:1500 start_codon:yes stop_codon:yes gene_type:complete
MKTIVLGPPGTGKTHTLLEQVEKYLKNTDPDKIGYFAFTKKAANEAKARAMDKFNYTEDDLPYFRTLHSLAFRKLGINKDQVMQKRHYEDLGRKLNLFLDYNEYDEEETGIFTTKSDYLRLIHLAKLRNITLEQQIKLGEHNTEVDYDTLVHLEQKIKDYKKLHNLIDYNDMILDFNKSDKTPKFDVVFIDEAQDLSLMQWDMAKTIWNKTEDTFIAGDDDQAIFRWAGADVDSFITQTGKLLNLTQSRRIPRAIHDFALGIIKRVSKRRYKEWGPRDYQGSLNFHDDIKGLNMSSGEWLILTRTRHMLEDVEEEMKERGWYFENRFKKLPEKDAAEAAAEWEAGRKGQPLNYKQIERIYSFMSSNHAEKIKLKGMTKEGLQDISTLKKDYGLKTDTVWYKAFDDLGFRRKNYIRSMRRNGENLKNKPRIQLSTIHSVKGGERNNVVLLTDLTHNTNKSYLKNPDDETRLFYVGATRTKENLHIIRPNDYEKAYPMENL